MFALLIVQRNGQFVAAFPFCLLDIPLRLTGRSFPISFGSFSGTYFEVCQSERYVQEAEGESSNKLTVSLYDQQGKHA